MREAENALVWKQGAQRGQRRGQIGDRDREEALRSKTPGEPDSRANGRLIHPGCLQLDFGALAKNTFTSRQLRWYTNASDSSTSPS